jgi:peptidoglycan/xylan/chitin deacetylase (PgdA/CDA1 family)
MALVSSYLKRIPRWVQWAYPSLIWRVEGASKEVFLTFDDGPHPVVTRFVLDCLAEYNAKATFFCVGEQIEKHPAIFEEIKAAGHVVANHTFHHVNGWKTPTDQYLKEFEATERLTKTKLFRPPYGKITPSQRKRIGQESKIVIYNKLSADFDKNISAEQCLQNVIGKGLVAGDIVLFHDSLKAEDRLRYALPKTLSYIYNQGLTVAPLRYELFS